MKKYMYILALASLAWSCNESSFLRETPQDFMSSDNAYVTETDFNLAVNDLYDKVRQEFYSSDQFRPFDYIYGTDIVFDGEPNRDRLSNMMSAFDPTSGIPQAHWDRLYTIVAGANAVIDRLPASQVTEEQRTQIEAKGLFFRGFAYRTLAYLFGGVPLELHEVIAPKTDYVRATKEETLQQAIADVKHAAETLKDITEVKDGEISSPTAWHLLSELYLAAGEYQNAVDAATKVIDNPALALMQNRFGTRATETPGDVYWDLYRQGNQNREGGNTEGIWVIQFETDVPGGGTSTASIWDKGNYRWERNCAPYTGSVKYRLTENGKVTDYSPFLWPVGDYTGGRGIGWAISTKYFSDVIWEDDFNGDIRNANHNFVRKFAINNPEFKARFGIDTIDTANPPANLIVGGDGSSTEIPGRGLYAYQSKCTSPYNHPDNLYEDPKTYKLKNAAGMSFADQYMFRLAETYLLRAEAYLMLGDKESAAKDINVVRNRAHAKPAIEEQIDMDYILDERMRELGIEEKRRITLMRTGTLYDRVMKCNPYYANAETCGDGVGMLPKYNVWPIPQSVREANTGALLEQNPEY